MVETRVRAFSHRDWTHCSACLNTFRPSVSGKESHPREQIPIFLIELFYGQTPWKDCPKASEEERIGKVNSRTSSLPARNDVNACVFQRSKFQRDPMRIANARSERVRGTPTGKRQKAKKYHSLSSQTIILHAEKVKIYRQCHIWRRLGYIVLQ